MLKSEGYFEKVKGVAKKCDLELLLKSEGPTEKLRRDYEKESLSTKIGIKKLTLILKKSSVKIVILKSSTVISKKPHHENKSTAKIKSVAGIDF